MRPLRPIKRAAIAAGVYGPVRWLQDHVLFRSRLKSIKELADTYAALIDTGDLCFDIGANIGDVTQSMLMVGGRVVAVDPLPSAQQELTARYRSNPRVEIEYTAVGPEAGDATLYVRDNHGASGLVKEWQSETIKAITVPVIRLEDLIAKHGTPAFCKIDVEGYEYEILRGLKQSIRCISIEYHFNEEDLEKCWKCLEHLNNIAAIEVNFMPFTKNTFEFTEWVSLAEFRNRFPGRYRQQDAYVYGDIYAFSKE